jgi:hypothetical protein
MALVAGLLLSLGIEVTQLYLPGRHATASDLLWNASGAAVGALLYLAAARQVSGVRRWGVAPWATLTGLTLVVSGALTFPAPTDVDYWGQWTPNLGYMPQYDGRVISAQLNDRPMYSRRLDHGRPHRDQFAGSWSVAGSVIAGTPPRGVSPILSIYDGRQQEILLLGAHRDDLVLRQRRRASALRLDAPDVRVPDAFQTVAEGDTILLKAGQAEGVTCLGLGGREWCGVGVTPGRTWGYLLYLEGPDERVRRAVDFLWMLGLFLCVGFFASGYRQALAGFGGALGATAATVAATPLVPGPPSEVLGALLGVGVGMAFLKALRKLAAAQWSPAA